MENVKIFAKNHNPNKLLCSSMFPCFGAVFYYVLNTKPCSDSFVDLQNKHQV